MPPHPHLPAYHRLFAFRRWPLRWQRASFLLGPSLGLCLLLFAAVALLLAHLSRQLAPMVRQRLITTMQAQLQTPVSVGAVQTSFRGDLLVHVDGLRAQSVQRGIPGDPANPALQVGHATIHIRPSLSMLGLLLRPHPSRPSAADTPESALPETATLLEHVSRVTLTDAHLTFATGDPGRAPLRFDLPRVELTGLARSAPATFRATVDAGAPVGLIETAGKLGPANLQDLRSTPLDGHFAFSKRPISTVPGMRGDLSMQGHFRGTLFNLAVDGESDDPAFAFDVSAHPIHLHTAYRMTIDAAHGVVQMDSIDAQFLDTRFQLAGTVTKSPATAGYVLDFALHAPAARMEDVLLLAARSQPSLLTGALAFDTHVLLPAGAEAIPRRLQFSNGIFRLAGARFGSTTAQRDADALSERALGHPQQATPSQASPSSAVAEGRVSLAAGLLRFQQVALTAPGVHLALAGTYALGGSAFAMAGTMHTDARVSQMLTGLHSLLARPFNSVLGHGSSGATIPIQITGSGNQPHFQLTLAGDRHVPAPAMRR